MAEHYIEVCKICGKVISQCRCISLDKQKRYDICSDCEKSENLHERIKELEAKVEKLKCCGNCGLYKYDECRLPKEIAVMEYDTITYKTYQKYGGNKCENWQERT